MHTIGSPEHAKLLVKTMAEMFKRLPAPSDPEQGYWTALDHVTWQHRNRTSGRTLFESTDPRALVHELSLYREPLSVFDSRHGEMPGRLPEDSYLQVTFRLYGWGSFLSRMAVTDLHPHRGYVNQLTHEVLDDTLRFEFRPVGSEFFQEYTFPQGRQRMVAQMANKLSDLIEAFAPTIHCKLGLAGPRV